MNMRVFSRVILVLVVCGIAVCAKDSEVLWNDECPYAFGKTLEEGKLLHREISDHYRDFRLQLAWQGGEPCRDPNEKLLKEMVLAKKIISDVLKPQFVPLETPGDRFLFLRDVTFTTGEKEALVVKFVKGKYIVKFMKTRMMMFVTVRPLSDEAMNVKAISEEVFNTKLLPPVWRWPFHVKSPSDDSKIIQVGVWLPQDNWIVSNTGYPQEKSDKYRVSYGPVGLGLYKQVNFCTNGKFISYKLAGGPPLPSKKDDEDEEPGD